MRTPLARTNYLLAVAVIVLLVVVAVIAGLAIVPAAILGVIVLAFLTAWMLAAARRTEHAGGARARMADEHDPVPSTPFIADDETPLGATSEQHEEISPHDLPAGHPGRAAAERQAGRSAAAGGEPLTAGDVEGGETVVRDDDLRTDRKEGGDGRTARDDVAWSAEDQGRGAVRGPRSSG